MHTETQKPCTCRLTSDRCDHTLDYVLPDGAFVALRNDVTRGRGYVSFTIAGGRVVQATRADLAVPITAAGYVAQLGANVDGWYAGRIDHAEFHARQGSTWDAIGAAGLDAEVGRLLRAQELATGAGTQRAV